MIVARHGSLAGLSKIDVIELVNDPNPNETTLKLLNHWPLPLYVCLQLTEDGHEFPPMKYLMNPFRSLIFWSGGTLHKPSWKWRAVEPKRLSMYGPDPASVADATPS